MNNNRNHTRKPKFKAVPTGKGNKAQRRAEEVVDTVEKGARFSKTNDPAWYDAFPQFVTDAGTVPFSAPLGNPLNLLGSGADPTKLANGSNFAIPGLMTIHFVPVPGISLDRTSPINRSATRIYTYLRAAQKARGDYDSQDMMMVLTALDSCYMYHAWMKRIYGIAQLASPQNLFYARSLIRANYVNPNDVQHNAAQLRAYINQFAISLGSFAVPKDMDMITRHQWMCSGIYLDSDSIKAQTYMFVPETFYKYDNTVTTGSQLTYVTPLTGGYTIADIIRVGDELLNAVFGDEDVATICGDIYNALGPDGVIKVEEIAPNYTVLPSYDRTVLAQIENSLTIPSKLNIAANFNVKQDPSVNAGAIIFNPGDSVGNEPYRTQEEILKPTLVWHGPQPSALDVIEMTRLIPEIQISGTQVKIRSCGVDLIKFFRIWDVPIDTTATGGSFADYPWKEPVEFTSIMNLAEGASITTMKNMMHNLAILEAFDWHPRVKVFVVTKNASGTLEKAELMGQVSDYENFAILEPEQLRYMHEAAVSSLFHLPQMGFRN